MPDGVARHGHDAVATALRRDRYDIYDTDFGHPEFALVLARILEELEATAQCFCGALSHNQTSVSWLLARHPAKLRDIVAQNLVLLRSL